VKRDRGACLTAGASTCLDPCDCQRTGVAFSSRFKGGSVIPSGRGSVDVKYHLGARPTASSYAAIHLHLSLTANRRNLEIGDPVVLGKVRATDQPS